MFYRLPLFVFVFFMLSAVFAHAEKSAGEHVDDATITSRVKFALLDQVADDAMAINVEVSKGVVQLSGWVSSDEVKSEAGRIAKATEGVVAVSNRLLVSTGKRSAGRTLDDSVLAAKVKLALSENENTNARRINVEVRNAVVELSGFVDSYDERDAAGSFVEDIDGVEKVINSIDITPR